MGEIRGKQRDEKRVEGDEGVVSGEEGRDGADAAEGAWEVAAVRACVEGVDVGIECCVTASYEHGEWRCVGVRRVCECVCVAMSDPS